MAQAEARGGRAGGNGAPARPPASIAAGAVPRRPAGPVRAPTPRGCAHRVGHAERPAASGRAPVTLARRRARNPARASARAPLSISHRPEGLGHSRPVDGVRAPRAQGVPRPARPCHRARLVTPASAQGAVHGCMPRSLDRGGGARGWRWHHRPKRVRRAPVTADRRGRASELSPADPCCCRRGDDRARVGGWSGRSRPCDPARSVWVCIAGDLVVGRV